MRKKTLRTLVAIVAGALLGGLGVFLLLLTLGKRAPAPPTPSEIPVGVPRPSPSPTEAASPTPSASADARRVRHDALGLALTLPQGYRVAEHLAAFEGSRTPRVVLTRATKEQEQQYVALLMQLREQQAATESPEFLPGKTITITRVTASADESFAAELAKAKDAITTAGDFKGTRYRRVEGMTTYDVTYLAVGANTVAVAMSYAAEEPVFDEEAYGALLNSLAPL